MSRPRFILLAGEHDAPLPEALKEIERSIESSLTQIAEATTALVELCLAATRPPAPPALAPRLLTVAQAAAALGLGESTVHALVRAGEIESVKIGTARRIPVGALDGFVQRLRAPEA